MRTLLQRWYRRRAEEVSARRLVVNAAQADLLAALPDVRLLNGRTQWGSCSPSGGLILNSALVKALSPCIDHLLCHLWAHSHGNWLYALLVRLVPDRRERRRESDGLAELILKS